MLGMRTRAGDVTTVDGHGPGLLSSEARRARRIGYGCVMLAAGLWAAAETVARALMDRGLPALEMCEARAWIAAACLALVLRARGLRMWPEPERGHGLRALAPFLLFGIALACSNLALFEAIARLPVAVAVLLQYAAPVLVVCWSALESRRAPSGRTLAALSLSLTGVLFVSGLLDSPSRRLDASGVALGLGAAFAFAACMVLAEKLGGKVGAGPAVARGFVFASIFWVVFQVPRGFPRALMDASFLPGIAFVGIVGTVLPFFFFTYGVGLGVGAPRASIVLTLEPVVAAVLALLFLGQSLGPMQIVGGTAIVGGVVVVQSARNLRSWHSLGAPPQM